MIQTVEAVIDKQGRVSVKEKIKPGKVRRALLTILDDEIVEKNESMVGSIEIIDDDLESGSREIANLFNQSLNRTEAEL
jgi:fructose-specific phosphotransferase system component IIB